MKLTEYMTYPVKIEMDPESAGYNVDIPCLPRAYTCGPTYDKAIEMAKALVTDIATFDAGEREILPGTTPEPGQPYVTISEDDALKIMLRNAMLEAGVSVSELARKDSAVRQSLTFGRATKFSTLATYFNAIGRPLSLTC